MIRLWKRSISVLLALVMVVGMIPTVAFAEEESLEEQPYVEVPVEEASVEEEPVEEEPVEEEPVEEEPVDEEPVEEEPVEEEPVEEEPVEEEPVEEEPVVEEPAAEEPAQQKVTIMALAKQYIADVAAMAVAEDEDPDGYIWLARTLEQEDIIAHVQKYGLSGMIRDSLIENYDGWDVYFKYVYTEPIKGSTTISMDAPDFLKLNPMEVAAWQYLAGAVEKKEDVEFVLTKDGEEDKYVVVGFRSLNDVKISIANQTIEAEEFSETAVGKAVTDCKTSISITCNGKSIPKAAAEITDATVTGKSWPKDNEEATVNPFITVTIRNSMNGETTDNSVVSASLTLKDTTPVYTVKYVLRDGEVVEAEPLAAGKPAKTYKDLTGVEEPSHPYYNFGTLDAETEETIKWVPEFEATINSASANANKEIIYTAQWTIKPEHDVNGNGTPDPKETFTVIFRDGKDGKAFKDITYELNAGAKTTIPADPKGYTVDGTTYNFVEWLKEGSTTPGVDKIVAATPIDPATGVSKVTVYVAQWTADHRVYFMMNDNISKSLYIIQTGQYAEAIKPKFNYQISTGVWYYGNADGEFVVDENGDKVKYEFTTPVTSDLYLVTEWQPDHNDNDIVDGTPGDPVEIHTWYDNGKLIDTLTITHDGNDRVVSLADPEYTIKDSYITWNSKWDYTNEAQGKILVSHEANVVPDKNGNTIDDSKETITVTSAGDGKVVVDGTNLIANGDGSYIYNSASVNDSAIKITAIPVVIDGISKTYVSKIQSGIPFTDDPATEEDESNELYYSETTWESLNYNEDYSVTYPVADARMVKTVEVIFGEAAMKLKETRVLPHIAGKPIAESNVYTTVVSEPAYVEEHVTLQYEARAAGDQLVPINDLVTSIDEFALPSIATAYITEAQFRELKDKALAELDKVTEVGEDGQKYYKVSLSAVWLDIDEPITEVSLNQVVTEAQADVMNSVMDSVMANPSWAMNNMQKVMDDALAQFTNTINLKARMANCHVFGRNTSADNVEVDEKLQISYADEKMRIVAVEDEKEFVTITLKDTRTATTISAENEVRVNYGEALSESILLEKANAKLTANGVEIDGLKLEGNYKDLIPGTYTMFLKYPGTLTEDGYKPAQDKTFKLIIVGPTITYSVDERVVSDKIDVIKEKAKPVIQDGDGNDVDFDNIIGLHVIAGYDMTQAGSLNFESGKLTNVQTYAKVKLSAKLLTMLENGTFEKEYDIDLDALDGQNIQLGYFSKIVTDMGKYLNKDLSKVLTVLEKLKMDPNVNVMVEICDEDSEPYPDENHTGVYLNLFMAIEDGIFTIAKDQETMVYGLIAYQPAFYMPDNGIQLTYNGQASHKLDLPSGAQVSVMRDSKTLTAEEYSIYYVGVTANGEPYMNAANPTKDGVYFASAVELAEDEQALHTDCALVTIGAQDAGLEIATVTKKNETDGPSAPEIKAATGAGLTVISGTAGIENPSSDMTAKEILENLYGNVNMEIPDALYEKLSVAWGLVFDGKSMPKETNRDELLAALKHIQTAGNEAVDEALGGFDSIADYVDLAKDYVNGGINELMNVVKLIPKDLTLSLGKDRQYYSAAGVYAYAAVVTDPGFAPAADAGLLVIENGETFELKNTEVTYDTEEHLADLDNDIGSDYMTVIKQGNKLNFLLEQNQEKDFIKKFEQWSGKELPENTPVTVSVGEVYGEGEKLSEKLTNFIIDGWIKPRAEAKIEEKFGGTKLEGVTNTAYDYAMSILENHLIPKAKTYLLNKFQAADGLDNSQTATIVLNGPKPVDVGTYDVYAVSYGVAVTGATLKIVPAEIDTVVLDNNAFIYDGTEKNVNVTTVKAGDLVVPADAYTITADPLSATNVGEYTVTVTANNPNYTGSASATWNINKAEITVTAENATITYGDDIPEVGLSYTCEMEGLTAEEKQKLVDLAIQDLKQDLIVNWNANEESGVGTYGTDYKTEAEYANWIVKYVDGTLTIEQKTISRDDFILGEELTYNGTEQTKSVTADGITFDVKDNTATNAGTHTMTITGKGNYTGEIKLEWLIAPKCITTEDVVKSATSLTYNGSEQTQEVLVTDGEKTLTVDADYTVTGNKRTNVATEPYKLTVTGTGNYTGSVEVEWNIAPKEIIEDDVVLAGELIYDGTEKTQAVDVSIKLIADAEATELVETQDYIVSDNVQTNVGAEDYTLTVTGTGNYTGTVTKSWNITPAPVVVEIENFEKSYGETDPEMVYTITEGLKEGAVLTVTLNREDKSENVGTYTLAPTVQITGDDLANYNISYKFTTGEDVTEELKPTLTIKVNAEEYICWNSTEGHKNYGQHYTDVTDALDTNEGATIQMLKDATTANKKDEVVVIVGADDTLDLNGFYVETDNLLSYGVVKDSAAETGGIKIGYNDYTILTKNNGNYLPVYDSVTSSYKFYEFVMESSDITEKTDDSCKFRFRIGFQNAEVYSVMKRTTESGIKIVLKMSWPGISGYDITYTMSDATVLKWANSQYSAPDLPYKMTLRTYGLSKLEKGSITAIPTVVTQTNVVGEGSLLEYQY